MSEEKEIFRRIREQIASDDVVLYMKGTPVFPQCGFSAGVVQVLSALGVKFTAYNVLEDMELRQGLKEFANWPTFPPLYIKGELVGGFDIVREMYESGELQQLLREKGIAFSEAA